MLKEWDINVEIYHLFMINSCSSWIFELSKRNGSDFNGDSLIEEKGDSSNDTIMDSFFVLAIGQHVFKKGSEKLSGYLNHIVTFFVVDRWHR